MFLRLYFKILKNRSDFLAPCEHFIYRSKERKKMSFGVS